MSAFFVTAQTIADAVQCMKENGICRDDLARDLWRMNATALVQRYGDKPESYDEEIAAYPAPHPSNDPFQLLKSANCLLYQCDEGDVPEMPLYAELESAALALMERLGGKESVNRNDRYQGAEWDRLS